VNGSPSPAQAASTTGLAPNIASALAYVAGPFSGLLVLLAEQRNSTVRFHAWQSIIGLGGLWSLGILLYVLAFASILFSASVFLVLLWISALVCIGSLAVCVICLLRAYRGERWKLPLAGDYAERKTETLNLTAGDSRPSDR
jgi:uncharacterized membrane protein